MGGGFKSTWRGYNRKEPIWACISKLLFAMERIVPSVSSANIDSDNKTSYLNERSLCAAN